ncbi:MAG TPA: TonB-dependent receptor plug domain-containing protein [Longimicrobiales bacterium]|nr:TonB-dependent receptor plug domain-containing protein [Longimicrobiales bacterium]
MLLLFALVLLTPSLAHAQKKSSSGLVTAADIAKYPNDPLERIIARMVSGVQVVRDDNGNNILQIRGAITIPDRESGAQFIKHPLYVVDGMAVHTPDGTLPDLEPQDLDSVRVLKGAEATAFGIEGSDGVIVFTTRRGKLRSK